MSTITTTHEFNVTSEDETTRTWKCTCGFWCTVEYKDAPDYHTPMTDRFASHLAKADAVESGKAFNTLPPGHHQYDIGYRENWFDGQPGQFFLWADGPNEIKTWPLTVDGIEGAAAWCDAHKTTWNTKDWTNRYPVTRGADIRTRASGYLAKLAN